MIIWRLTRTEPVIDVMPASTVIPPPILSVRLAPNTPWAANFCPLTVTPLSAESLL